MTSSMFGAPPGSRSVFGDSGDTELSAQAAVMATSAINVLQRIWRAGMRTFSERESRGDYVPGPGKSRRHTTMPGRLTVACNSKTDVSLGEFHDRTPPSVGGAHRS